MQVNKVVEKEKKCSFCESTRKLFKSIFWLPAMNKSSTKDNLVVKANKLIR
jgi:hypothetical protein